MTFGPIRSSSHSLRLTVEMVLKGASLRLVPV